MGLRRLGSLSFRDNLTMAGVVQFHAKLLRIERLSSEGGDVITKQNVQLEPCFYKSRSDKIDSDMETETDSR